MLFDKLCCWVYNSTEFVFIKVLKLLLGLKLLLSISLFVLVFIIKTFISYLFSIGSLYFYKLNATYSNINLLSPSGDRSWL